MPLRNPLPRIIAGIGGTHQRLVRKAEVGGQLSSPEGLHLVGFLNAQRAAETGPVTRDMASVP